MVIRPFSSIYVILGSAVTAQNTQEVSGVFVLPAEFVGKQLDSVLGDMGAQAIKLGMLANADIIQTVAEKLTQHHTTAPIVLDTVMYISLCVCVREREVGLHDFKI